MTVTNIGTNSEGSESGSSLSIGIPVGGVPKGSLIVVLVQENGSPNGLGSLGAVTDTAGNSYSAAASAKYNSNGNWFAIFFAFNSLVLSSGNSIKYTFGRNGNDCAMSAFYAINMQTASSPLDAAVTASQANQTSSGGGSFSSALVSGTPAVAGELIVAGVSSGGTSFTQSSGGWATPPNKSTFNDSTLSFSSEVAGGTLTNSGTSTVSFSPNIGGGNSYAAIIVGFKPLKLTSGFNMPMLGM